MPALNSKPGTVTSRQLTRLHQVAHRRGIDHEGLRDVADVESLKLMSADEASALIARLGGGGLPNPPGEKPIPSRSRPRSGTKGGPIRMITQDQIEQITRLGLEYFHGHKTPVSESRAIFLAWLKKHHKVDTVRELATAEKAGEVIAVLKGMHNRRATREP